MDPTLYEGTQSLWPMALAALALWVTYWVITRRGE
jgi:hypothetical protein